MLLAWNHLREENENEVDQAVADASRERRERRTGNLDEEKDEVG